MNDSEFLKAFEECTLTEFPHRSHIRMAWLYLRAHDWETAIDKIRDGIRYFAESKGARRKYHETITIFWARAVLAAVQAAPEISDFEVFAAQHPQLFDSRYIERYYTPALLHSEFACREWVEPDLQPLPIFIKRTSNAG